jgi:hypothetical protein
MKPIFLLLSLVSSIAQSDFHEKVLSDFKRNSFFIACEINSPQYIGQVIIENGNLYYFLSKTRGFTKDKYKSFMKEKLSRQDTIKIDDSNFVKWRFIKVNKSESVNIRRKSGIDNFIKYYFEDSFIRKNLDYEERNAVIYQLFQWKIAAKIHHESGYIMGFR